MPLLQVSAPFDDPDFLYEVKFDGFRALAYVDDGTCELVSRKGHTYKRFQELSLGISSDLKAHSAILDGEIVCLDDQGRSRFYDLMFHRGEILSRVVDRLQPGPSRICMARYTNVAMTATPPTSSPIAPQS